MLFIIIKLNPKFIKNFIKHLNETVENCLAHYLLNLDNYYYLKFTQNCFYHYIPQIFKEPRYPNLKIKTL